MALTTHPPVWIMSLNILFFFLTLPLKEAKIMMSNEALNELHRLEEISCNRNPRMWMNEQQGVFRIATMNCAGLSAHFEDIKADERLLKADILLLQETSLSVNDPNDFEIISHPVKFHVKDGRGKGVSVYMKPRLVEMTHCIDDGFQIAKISLKEFDVINVYRSCVSSKDRFCDKLTKFLDSTRGSIILGDFNICGQREKSSQILKSLNHSGYTQLVKDPTHIRGRQIDHIYIEDKIKKNIVEIERHSAYYTDHDALLLTMTFQVGYSNFL